jgi:hypothetical protein
MADIEHRNVQLAVQPLQVGQDFLLALQVERGQRLVHQQQARVDGQGTGDADPLAFATREQIGFAVEQMADAQQLDGLIETDPLRAGDALQAVAQVAHHREMGKQAGLLEHVADGPLVRWHPAGGVLPHLAIDGEPSLRGTLQPGNAAQQRGFTRAGVPEQRSDAPTGQARSTSREKPGQSSRKRASIPATSAALLRIWSPGV